SHRLPTCARDTPLWCRRSFRRAAAPAASALSTEAVRQRGAAGHFTVVIATDKLLQSVGGKTRFPMKEIYTEVEIQAPAERIWAHLADLARFPRWHPFTRWVSGKARTGEQLEVHLQQSGTRGMTLRPTVLKAEPNREIRWRGRRGLLGLFESE